MLQILAGKSILNFGLIVVDIQNGFLSKGGSYDRLGMNIENYQKVVPTIKHLIEFCRNLQIPVFYTEAVREPSGIDLLLNIHNILPRTREERIEKIPICVRGTWDAQTIDEIKPTEKDHVVVKRRDSAFQDTELRVWLQSIGVNTLVFCGVDTSICVETSIRDAFNLGYDIILISDATASGTKSHYETTLARVRDYYGLQMSYDRFTVMMNSLDKLRKEQTNLMDHKLQIDKFIEEFGLLDFRDFNHAPVQTLQ